MKQLILLLFIIALLGCKKEKSTSTPPPIKEPNPPALYKRGKYHGLYINVNNNQDSLFVYTPYFMNGDTVTTAGYKLFTKRFGQYMAPHHACVDNTVYSPSNTFMNYYNCAMVISVFPPVSSGVHITTTCNTISPVLLTITADTVNLTIKTRFFTVPCLTNSKDTTFIYKKQ